MTVRTDEEGRLSCLEWFPPNTLVTIEAQEDGSVRIAKSSGEATLVQAGRTKEGFLMVPVKLRSEDVADAIRADRDSQ
jgi:hypothetical protein